MVGRGGAAGKRALAYGPRALYIAVRSRRHI
jgi:hypothetical protein